MRLLSSIYKYIYVRISIKGGRKRGSEKEREEERKGGREEGRKKEREKGRKGEREERRKGGKGESE